MTSSQSQQSLARRHEILKELDAIYPLHRGTVYEYFRKCGKPTCRCAKNGEQGHLLRLLTWKEGNRSRALQLKSPESYAIAEQHVKAYQRHQDLVEELVKIGEQLSEVGIVAGKDEEAKKNLGSRRRERP